MTKRTRNLLFAFALSIVSVSAQDAGSLTGQVMDPSHGIVSAAKVSVRSDATGATFSTLTDGSGFYRVPQLEPGSYTLTASATGFRTSIQNGIIVQVNDRLRIDLQLEVGQVTERVTVQSVLPLLQAEDAIVGQVIDNRKIVDLPLNARNWLQLATLAAGTVTYPGVVSLDAGNRQNIIMNIGGNRTANTNYLLDGGDNNGQFISGSLTQPPVDSLQEFKVETNNYTADAGRLGGAVVNATIKSGTNSFHGSAYDFLRNRELNGQNFFAAPTAAKPEFTRNQYGASLGGPLLPNRLFFFLNYEGNRQRQDQISSRQVFTDAQKSGDFSSNLGAQVGVDAQGQPVFGGQIFDPFSVRRLANGTAVRDPVPANRIPASRLNPASKTLIDTVPGPNRSGSPNFVRDVSNPLNVDTYVGRMDWVHGKDTIFGHFLYSDQDGNTAPILGLPADGGDTNLLLSQQR